MNNSINTIPHKATMQPMPINSNIVRKLLSSQNIVRVTAITFFPVTNAILIVLEEKLGVNTPTIYSLYTIIIALSLCFISAILRLKAGLVSFVIELVFTIIGFVCGFIALGFILLMIDGLDGIQ